MFGKSPASSKAPSRVRGSTTWRKIASPLIHGFTRSMRWSNVGNIMNIPKKNLGESQPRYKRLKIEDRQFLKWRSHGQHGRSHGTCSVKPSTSTSTFRTIGSTRSKLLVEKLSLQFQQFQQCSVVEVRQKNHATIMYHVSMV